MTPILMHCVALPNLTELFFMSKMKNVAKNEIVLYNPYSNALCPTPLLVFACPWNKSMENIFIFYFS